MQGEVQWPMGPVLMRLTDQDQMMHETLIGNHKHSYNNNNIEALIPMRHTLTALVWG